MIIYLIDKIHVLRKIQIPYTIFDYIIMNKIYVAINQFNSNVNLLLLCRIDIAVRKTNKLHLMIQSIQIQSIIIIYNMSKRKLSLVLRRRMTEKNIRKLNDAM
jgi:hypothetical protein